MSVLAATQQAVGINTASISAFRQTVGSTEQQTTATFPVALSSVWQSEQRSNPVSATGAVQQNSCVLNIIMIVYRMPTVLPYCNITSLLY